MLSANRADERYERQPKAQGRSEELVSYLSPPPPDPDFEIDDIPQPPSKRKKTSSSVRQKSRGSTSKDERPAPPKKNLPKKKKSGCDLFHASSGDEGSESDLSDPDDRKLEASTVKYLSHNPLYKLLGLEEPHTASTTSGKTTQISALNPLLKPALKSLLSSPAKNLSSPSKLSLDPEEDGSETEPESDHEFPPADAKRDIGSREGEGDEGSATESEAEDETESSPQPSTRLANSLPSTPPIKSLSKEDREIKPNLIPRADQTARGKFVLKRPKECYDGTPVAAGSTNDSVPASVNRFLRDYQREGIQFFYDRWCEGRGGVLGDDMGLGKTVQVISFLAAIDSKDNDIRDKDRRRNWVEKWQREHERKKNTPPMPKANFKWPTALIIVPKTLIDNWERELDTWGYFEVGTYRDANERADVLTDFRMGRLDILLTSYELVRQNIDKFESLALSVIFLDEAHKIKNSSSTITKNFMRFDCLVRFGLTGTALQNDYAELWTLLDWTNPGRLGTRQQWKNTIVKPLKAGQSHTSSAEEQDRAIALGKAFSQKLLPNFLLRRTKDLIKHQLPNKTDDVIFCPLTTLQLAAYKNILNSPAVHGLLRKDDPCDCEVAQLELRSEGKTNKTRGTCCYAHNERGEKFITTMLAMISVLIKVSNHPALLYPTDNDSPEQKERSHELLEIAFPNQPNLRKRSAIYLPNMCGKWNVLKGLLHAWHNAEAKNKVLIFSKSVKLLKFLETEVEKNFGSSKMCYLDGQTKSELRMPLVDSFNNDPNKFIFLISTTAGGTGLNLTSANRVVIFDPHWNPAHDLQAMDRAYRYGQTRDVYVIRLLGAGALEELIYARQIYKQQQMNIAYEGTAQTRFFEGVHGDKTKQGELFGLKNIFSLQPSAYATKHVIERARVEELEWALTTDGRKLSDDDDVRGAGALLIDDSSLGEISIRRKAEQAQEAELVSGLLGAAGGGYRHRNSEVLAPLRLAAEAAEEAAAARKRKRSISTHGNPGAQEGKEGIISDSIPGAAALTSRANSSKTSPNGEVGAWHPPKRSKHAHSKIKPLLTGEKRLRNRKRKLIEHGFIEDSEESLAQFALAFAKFGSAEQKAFLHALDNNADFSPAFELAEGSEGSDEEAAKTEEDS